jgi:hypothetical protein
MGRCAIEEQEEHWTVNVLVKDALIKRHCLTPWRRFPLEKLPVDQVVNKLTAFYEIRRFITVFRRAHHWSVLWDAWIHFTPIMFMVYFDAENAEQ